MARTRTKLVRTRPEIFDFLSKLGNGTAADGLRTMYDRHSRVESIVSENNGLKEANKDLQTEKESLFEANQNLAEQNNRTRNELNAEALAHDSAKQKIQELNDQVTAFRSSNDRLADVLRDTTEEKDRLSTENRKLQAEIEELRTDIDELKTDLRNTEASVRTMNKRAMEKGAESRKKNKDAKVWKWLFWIQLLAWPLTLAILDYFL